MGGMGQPHEPFVGGLGCEPPSRDDGGTTVPGRGTRPGGAACCPVCERWFVPLGRQAYCSSPCRKRAFRARHNRPRPPRLPAGARRRHHTVYECPTCEVRQVGEQRCADCGVFGRSLGLGGECPSCGEPVAAGELGLDADPADTITPSGRDRRAAR